MIEEYQTKQPTRGEYVTVVWQTAMEIVSTPPPPSISARFTDIETNAGRTTTRKQVWVCDICLRR